ncbi:MAG: hypothetical protein H7Z41_16625 [Cytophagales bacterium]|nr:hypothetical protein [Armatimonadota bacterium]
MAEEQRLRWWQEEREDASQQAAEQIKRLSAPPPEALPAPLVGDQEQVTPGAELHDTWADLETEAVRRVELAKTEASETLSLCLDKTAALARHRKEERLGWWLGGMAVLLLILLPLLARLLLPGHTYHGPNIGSFAGLFVILIQGIQRGKWLRSLAGPVVRLTPTGIHLNTANHPDVSLPWNEIVEVTPRRFFKQRWLEIRGTKRRRYTVQAQDLPISVDALIARIAVYETGRLSRNS